MYIQLEKSTTKHSRGYLETKKFTITCFVKKGISLTLTPSIELCLISKRG
jgi:hypothetical protein